jgi:hypothetical protein
MTEKRNQRELLWFQTGGALNFITAAPHCGDKTDNSTCVTTVRKLFHTVWGVQYTKVAS